MATTTKTTGEAKATFTKYGRVGTASELYKRCIAALRLRNDEAWSAVASVLGLEAAGSAAYPSWYRCQLKRAR